MQNKFERDTPYPLTITEQLTDGTGVSEFVREGKNPIRIRVPYSLPNEELECTIFQSRKHPSFKYVGDIKEIKKSSPDRVAPRCKHFGMCGGCTLQHMPYEMQLDLKENAIRGYFQNSLDQDTIIHPIIRSKSIWEYRNKMEFTFSESKEKFLGLIIGESRGKVFNLTECHLGSSWFVDALLETKKWWEERGLNAYNLRNNTGALRTLTVRNSTSSNDRLIMLTISGNPDYALKKSDIESFRDALLKTVTPEKPGELSIVVRIQQIMKGKPTQFYEMVQSGPGYIREIVDHLEFQLSPSSFFQPNTFTAPILIEKMRELGEINSDSVVYDLYCGSGVLGMSVAHIAKRVIAIEQSMDAAFDAEETRKRLGLENYTIFTGDTAKVLKEKRSLIPSPDVVIVDPPRSGLDNSAISQLVELKPKTIIFISCNPKIQAENVAILKNSGYLIKSIQPLDQFPHTAHIENIVILKQKPYASSTL